MSEVGCWKCMGSISCCPKTIFFYYNILQTYKKIYIIYAYKIERNSKFSQEKIKEVTKVAVRDKNIWILILCLLAGLVIGGLLGDIAKNVDFLWWLSYGEEFGLTSPITLDLNVITLTFGLTFKINVASIIGMVIAIFVYRKI